MLLILSTRKKNEFQNPVAFIMPENMKRTSFQAYLLKFQKMFPFMKIFNIIRKPLIGNDLSIKIILKDEKALN